MIIVSQNLSSNISIILFFLITKTNLVWNYLRAKSEIQHILYMMKIGALLADLKIHDFTDSKKFFNCKNTIEIIR